MALRCTIGLLQSPLLMTSPTCAIMHLALMLSLFVVESLIIFLLTLPLERMLAKSKKGGGEISLLGIPRMKSAIKLLLCPNYALC